MRGLILLAVVTLTYAKSIEQSEPLSAFGYNRRVAIPLAEEIRKKEEALFKQGALGRIAGGSSTALGQIPYQAGVLTNYTGVFGSGVCGGSLVSANKVIYAAHCWFDGLNQGYSCDIVLGSTTIFFGGSRQRTSNVIIHPQWDPMHISNDVAVITLLEAVQFSRNIAPIAMPSGSLINELFVGEVALASGYGRTGDTGDEALITLVQTLSHVNLTIITNAECRNFYPFNVIDSTLCTFDVRGISTCGGDSGGPLAITRNGQPVLVGIVSFGSAWGCTIGAPAGFARVTSFLSFFNEHL